jgi:hypothetical protein
MKMVLFYDVAPFSVVEVYDVSEMLSASIIILIALMLEEVSSSENL